MSSDLSSTEAVILCGGRGTRFGAETETYPKPMAMIGDRPILWHIMSHYARYGVRNFVLCLGYKGNVIRDYFINYWRSSCDIEINLANGSVDFLDAKRKVEDWNVKLLETGEETLTGERILRVLPRISGKEFFVTYGDGVSSVDIAEQHQQFRRESKKAMITAVRPSSRFGEIDIQAGQIVNFQEKPQAQGGWINGGFMVFDRSAFDHLMPGSNRSLEQGVLEVLAAKHQLSVYSHEGFWQCMDTVRERDLLSSLWASGQAPWISKAE